MTRILILSGSLRAASCNTLLAHAATALLPEGASAEVATLHGIPLYDGDVEEREGMPPAVLALKQKVLAADGLLLATPEYNSGMPGVLKNGLDWLSRADRQAVFRGRPVGLMGATPGGFGTLGAQAAWLPVLKALAMQVYSGGTLYLSRVHTALDAQGRWTDAQARQMLADFLAGFAAFVARQRG